MPAYFCPDCARGALPSFYGLRSSRSQGRGAFGLFLGNGRADNRPTECGCGRRLQHQVDRFRFGGANSNPKGGLLYVQQVQRYDAFRIPGDLQEAAVPGPRGRNLVSCPTAGVIYLALTSFYCSKVSRSLALHHRFRRESICRERRYPEGRVQVFASRF